MSSIRYRGYYIYWSAYENCYQVRKYTYNHESVILARRDTINEAQMCIDDMVDDTTKEDEYERQQIEGGISIDDKGI